MSARDPRHHRRRNLPLIPAPPGIVARYKQKDGKREYHHELAVVAFDDDGAAALVLGETGLVAATTYSNFDGLSDSPQHPEYVMLIPAGGWRVERTGKDGSRWSEPLAAWALKSSGAVAPLTVDGEGYVEDFQGYADSLRDGYWVYHPDAVNLPEGTAAT
jgi:hypothetical protein